jgi:hypothetical protein
MEVKMIQINIEVLENKANVKASSEKMNAVEIGIAVTQLETLKLNLLGRLAKNNKHKVA